MQRGRGTFILERPSPPDPAARMERLRDPAQRLLSQAALSGVSFEEVLELLDKLRKEMGNEGAGV